MAGESRMREVIAQVKAPATSGVGVVMGGAGSGSDAAGMEREEKTEAWGEEVTAQVKAPATAAVKTLMVTWASRVRVVVAGVGSGAARMEREEKTGAWLGGGGRGVAEEGGEVREEGEVEVGLGFGSERWWQSWGKESTWE